MTIATRFGKGRRVRRKTDEDDETSIADEANLWWTRGDFVQHAVIRNRAHPAPPLVAEPDRMRDDGGAESTDCSFSTMFTTESLYQRTIDPSQPTEPTAARPAQPEQHEPPPRPRHTPNHPLDEALHCLGLDGDATWSDVQHAYRARAKEAHPDRTGDDGLAMADLNATYESLRNGRRYGLFGDD